jgi:HECT-domain (ubiquitin-transferase)
MRELTQEDLRRFIKFAWGQERLPVDDEEWKRTNTRMMIKPYMRAGANQDNVFPKADTCFFNIELPKYSSKEILKNKLLTAIYTDADSMDADVNEEDQFGGLGGGGLGRLGGRAPARRRDQSSLLFGGF